MPQYLAETPLHCVIRSEIPAIYNTKDQMISPKQRRVFAKFKRGQAPLWAQEIARTLGWAFRGMPEGVTVEQWVSFYDSKEAQEEQGWTDEEHAAIVEKLDQNVSVRRVEPPKVPAPWPTYDTFEGSSVELAERVAELGLDPHAVIAYEQQNQNRTRVLTQLAKLLNRTPVEEAPQEIVA